MRFLLSFIVGVVGVVGVVVLIGCARESHDATPVASVEAVDAAPPSAPAASVSVAPSASTSASASASSAPVVVAQPPKETRHGACCKQPSDCGEMAACSGYPFHITGHCARVCRNRCKTNADCPLRGGSPSSLSCQDGLCELDGPGN